MYQKVWNAKKCCNTNVGSLCGCLFHELTKCKKSWNQVNHSTPQPLYNTVRFNRVLDITQYIKMDPKNVQII